MNERGTRPSVNRKTVDSYLIRKMADLESLFIIVAEYQNMVKSVKEKFGISSEPVRPDNIRLP